MTSQRANWRRSRVGAVRWRSMRRRWNAPLPALMVDDGDRAARAATFPEANRSRHHGVGGLWPAAVDIRHLRRDFEPWPQFFRSEPSDRPRHRLVANRRFRQHRYGDGADLLVPRPIAAGAAATVARQTHRSLGSGRAGTGAGLGPEPATTRCCGTFCYSPSSGSVWWILTHICGFGGS